MRHISAPIRDEGAGARVRRLFPSTELRWPATDPFLLFDEFFVAAHAGFPDHPHRGFEIITYMLEGGFQHRDSLGNAVSAPAGHAMHFVTGSGIIHSEMPIGSAHGIQLWINLRRTQKAIAPSLRLISPDEMPQHTIEGGYVRRIASPSGPIVLHTAATYDDVVFNSVGSVSWDVSRESVALVYVIEGEIKCTDTTIHAGQMCVFDGEPAEIQSSSSARAIVLTGQRQHESIRFVGPFVD
ncbi:MAG: pirin family protein [Chlorobi bacterium]|nr:pirin family protein [Chlorobiota bacterium]